MIVERILRVAAFAIAVLALIDPTLTLAARQRPVVAVSVVGDLPSARPVIAQLETALAAQFEAREGPAPDAAAQILVGDGSFPSGTPLVDGVPLFGVAIDDAPTPNVRVLHVDAPARAPLTSPLRVTATVEARGMSGRSSTIMLRADDLEMARATQAWTQATQTATITLDAMPFRAGLARLSVSAEPLASEATSADNRLDTATEITADKIPVLVMDARPSWMTRFARQALDGDDRFTIKTLSRVSRGLTAATPDTPQALTLATLEPFAVVMVGAPEALTRADVDALRDFARLRGGIVIFAPDQQPTGAYVDLLPAHAFEEKVQDEPAAVRFSSPPATAAAATTTATAGPAAAATIAPPAFAAAELALPRELLPGAEVLARVGDARGGVPVILSTPAGDGEVVFIGALDAWRHRDTGGDAKPPAAGNAGAGFDATWRQLLGTLAARVPPPIAVSLDSPVVAPGGRVDVHIRLRRTLVQPNGGVPALVARLTQPDASTADESALRIWPGEAPGAYVGSLNAPPRTGVYAVSVGFDRGPTAGRATLLVASPAPVAAMAWDGLRTFVDAHGGLVFTSTDIPRLITQLQQRVPASPVPRARHPFRSAWWIAPFAACLGGEWWLRRRRGQR